MEVERILVKALDIIKDKGYGKFASFSDKTFELFSPNAKQNFIIISYIRFYRILLQETKSVFRSL